MTLIPDSDNTTRHGADTKPMNMSIRFLKTYLTALKRTWPIWNGIFFMLIAFAALFAIIEDMRFFNALYFTLVTALTIGYGDIVPTQPLGKIIAVLIGFLGASNMGFFVALAIHSANQCLGSDYKLK